MATITVATNAELQSALAVAVAGTTIIFEPGEYSGFQFSKSGTPTASIVFSAQPGVIINGIPGTTNGYIDISGCNYVTLQGFTIQASGTVARAGIWGGGSAGNNVDGIVIQNNVISGTDWWGILFGFTNNIIISNNNVSFVQVQHGIYVGNSSLNAQIVGNTCHDCHGCGIEVNADSTQGGSGISTGFLISGNKLYNNAQSIGASINMDGLSNSLIENNLIYGGPLGQRNGIALYQVNGFTPSMNNTIVNNTIVINDNGPAGFAAISVLNGSTGNTIYNNICSAAEDSLQIDEISQPGTKCDYNIWGVSGSDPTGNGYTSNISLSQWQSQLGFDLHSIQVANIDSLFVSVANGQFPQNFQLAYSQAVGMGIATNAPAVDIVGDVRGTRIDIGCYEYPGSLSSSSVTSSSSQSANPVSSLSSVAPSSSITPSSSSSITPSSSISSSSSSSVASSSTTGKPQTPVNVLAKWDKFSGNWDILVTWTNETNQDAIIVQSSVDGAHWTTEAILQNQSKGYGSFLIKNPKGNLFVQVAAAPNGITTVGTANQSAWSVRTWA